MLESILALPPDRPPRVLCLGAHSDDIEIGAAATLARLLAARPDAEMRWTVFTASPERAAETRAAALALGEGRIRVECERFRDGSLPADLGPLKARFEALKAFEPDLVVTHHGRDAHQDHRAIAGLTASTWRSHSILEYEIPKYDGDLGNPAVFVPLSPEEAGAKPTLLLEHFASQRRRPWFDESTFMALMRLRGVQCAAPGGYAEAFHAPKQRLGFAPPGARAQTISSSGIGNTSRPPQPRT